MERTGRRTPAAKEVAVVESQRFWSRVGQWFKKSEQDSLPASSVLSSPGAGDPVMATSARAAIIERPGHTGPLGRFRRSGRGVELARLRAQYAHVENLMDAIQRHMESQADRSERIACSLDRLAQSLSGVPETFRHQLELLTTISETAVSEQARMNRMEESLAQWPEIADAQRETMVSISRQLDAAREMDERVTSTINECRVAFGHVEEATTTSTSAVERFAATASASNERIATLMHEQDKRFRSFSWSAMVLAGIATVIAVISLLS